MDPLTHTLFGANLAATRLREKTRLATAALVVGANLPDVDAILYFTGHDDLARGFRRGWTHGVLAILVLPFILSGVLLLYDKLRPSVERKVNAPWLFGLSALGVLTHPSLDWLNSYGMRWLMPFDGKWSYGDSVYIMDPWLWLILGAGWLGGRTATPRLYMLWATFSLLIAWVVGRRAAEYLGVVVAVALVLLVSLWWRPAGEPRRSMHRFAAVGLTLATLYIGARLAIHEQTERAVTRELARHDVSPVERLMVSPRPIDPRSWDFVAQFRGAYRYGHFVWGSSGLELAPDFIPVARETPEWAAARRDPAVRGFVTWMRFPAYDVERRNGDVLVHIHDARSAPRRGRALGGPVVVLRRR